MAPAVVTEIVGTIVVDGVKRLLERFVDELGKIVWRTFADLDGDGVPDDYDNPIDIWDEEPEGWLPFDHVEGELPDDVQSIVIFMTPDGPAFSYNIQQLADGDSALYELVVSKANDYWIEANGAIAKPFRNYSVTEALLFIIAFCSLFWLAGKIFKRRKF